MAAVRWIPPAKLRAAHTLYRSGMSTGEISRLIYKQFGYRNWQSCQAALIRGFRRNGMERRSFVEVGFVRFGNGTCKACGCPMVERTRGCDTCKKRHYRRRLRAGEQSSPTCVSCGTHWDSRTAGCESCRKRHYKRHYKRALATVEPPPAGIVGGRGEGTTLPEAA